jgi:hypothetical protein
VLEEPINDTGRGIGHERTGPPQINSHRNVS